MAYATIAVGNKTEAKQTERKDIMGLLFLAPLTMAIFSIVLAIESPIFVSAMALVGLE
jgi:hypothetical protein